MVSVKNLLVGSNSASPPPYVEDVYSSVSYVGNSSQNRDIPIPPPFDVTTGEFLVWVWSRELTARPFSMCNTLDGPSHKWNGASGEHVIASNHFKDLRVNTGNLVTSPHHIRIGGDNDVNGSGYGYHMQLFKKAPRFFDMIQYTGNGQSSQIIDHELELLPHFGFVSMKSNGGLGSPYVHLNAFVANREYGQTGLLYKVSSTNASFCLDNNNSAASQTYPMGIVGVTNSLASKTQIDVAKINAATGSYANATNKSGYDYTIYLFAHDPHPDGVIKQHYFIGNGGSSVLNVDVGFEPQFLMMRNPGLSRYWYNFDTMRRWPHVTSGSTHDNTDKSSIGVMGNANTKSTEHLDGVYPRYYGFDVDTGNTDFNYNQSGGGAFWYMAIRKSGMHKPKTNASEELYGVATYTGNSYTWNKGFGSAALMTGVDAIFHLKRSSGDYNTLFTRLREQRGKHLDGTSTEWQPSSFGIQAQYNFHSLVLGNNNSTTPYAYETADSRYYNVYNSDTAFNQSGTNYINFGFKRRREFFDIVVYTGDGTASQAIPHQLQTEPWLRMVFPLSFSSDAYVHQYYLGRDKYLKMNDSMLVADAGKMWGNQWADDQFFYVGDDSFGNIAYDTTNKSGHTYMALLFAKSDGIHIHHSGYSGSFPSKNITLPFSPRFMLFKKYSGTLLSGEPTPEWWVLNTGIGFGGTGNDYWIPLSSNGAEQTGLNIIQTTNSVDWEVRGLNSSYPLNNANMTSSYIYMAIA